MKTRFVLFIVLLLTLGLALAGAAFAQAPTLPVPTRAGYVPPAPVTAPDWDDAGPAGHALPSTFPFQPSTAVPSIAIGQPGLSFRYVQTFGETETAYPEDSSHFYDVQGLGIAGNNIWVTDSWADRVLKFDANGSFLQKVGEAGFRDSTGTPLDYVTDVAVDSSGNIWVVDGGAVHVVKYDSAGNKVSELGEAWSSGSDNAHFNDPISIAFDAAGNTYVSDSGLWGDYGNHRVQVFNSSGTYLTTIGQTGVAGPDNNHLHRPRGIAVYGNRLYVADTGNHRVQIFDITNPASPSYVATLGTGVRGNLYLQFDSPEGVGVDANYIYVADSNNQRVQIFDRNTLVYNGLTIGAGTSGTDNNHFNHPTDVVIDAIGNIYVADDWNKRVQQYNSSRVYQRTYGTTGVSYMTDGYHYYFPMGVAVGRDGSLHIVEERGHRLVKLDANGVLQWTVGEPGQNGDDNSHFFGPQDVAVDAQGRVYVVESWNNYRVQIFNSDGTFYATLGAGWGTGPNQFKSPQGLAIDGSGNILVADSGNHRVQFYNPARAYVATLGQTGVSGSDNSHFSNPTDVVVDANGVIYVADEGNDRVQVFNEYGQYVRTIGGGGTGSDLGHFAGWGPERLAVDAQNRLYVADSGNNRIQVFDAAGAYLTTIGGSWGNRTGQFRGPFGVAIGPDGAVYVADHDNNRVQKFAAGVPGWRQVNINGFGERSNGNILTLAPFDGRLYAGTSNYGGQGSQLWRMNTSGAWTPVMQDGFGDPQNIGIDHLAEFDGKLYAGTWNENRSTGATAGGQVWRSSNGTDWSQVVAAGFGDPSNGEAYYLAPFKDQLYAATWSYTTTHGAEIWRSSTGDSGDWTRVVTDGFGDVNNAAIMTMETFGDHLYAGTYNWDSAAMTSTGGTVWRTGDGVNWAQVNTPGFGSVNLNLISSLAAFNGYLYAGTAGPYLVWRCQVCDGSDWQKVQIKSVAGTAGGPSGLYVSGNQLYYSSGDQTTGMEVWRTADGIGWEQVGFAGFGNGNNRYTYYDNAMATYGHHLYIGTQNSTDGGQVWVKTLTADFTATPTRGVPPLVVQFANTSVGDFTSSQWDFGDGGTSTEISPTHTYTAAGTYTVTLTIGDGTDMSTLSKPAYIVAKYATYLPLTMRN